MIKARRLFALLAVVAVGVTTLSASEPIRRRYLVGTEGPAWAFEGSVRSERSFTPFRHVDGFAVELTDEQLIELSKRDDVLYVEPDVERHALETRELRTAPGGPWVRSAARMHPVRRPTPNTQEIAYGVTLTKAPSVWPVTKGAGVKVGVIDTGIDINHPDLVDRYKGGQDFVNADDDPQDDNGHGTHVSGIIGASDNNFGVVGVAPAVDLYGLKVLDANGNGSAFNIIRAVEWAIDNGLDVINLSLGGGSFSTTEDNEFKKAVAAGIVCVAASGNSYPDIPTVDYPASYSSVIAVGAVDSGEVVANFSQRGTTLELMGAGVEVNSTLIVPNAYRIQGDGFPDVFGFPMNYSPLPDSANGNLVASGIGNQGDFPAEVSGNLALIQRGTLTFRDKEENAKMAGATGAIIYNNVPGGFLGTLCSDTTNCSLPNIPVDPIVTVSVSKEDGETYLVPHAGSAVTMSKTNISSYGLLEGTSMASPHVAGVAALLKALAPTATPAEIRSAMDDSAVDLGDPGRDTTYGFGLADAYAAGMSLAPAEFSAATFRPAN